MCHKPKCNCRERIIFTPKQFQVEIGSIQSKLQKTDKATQTAWNKFPKPAINATVPFKGMTVIAKIENPKVGQVTTNILKSISGGRIVSLTDMHGNGLRLEVM